MARFWPWVKLLIKLQMTFHSGSADLEAVILGVPHHQVGEATTAVAEVRSQAPAHATEDGATQAGNKVLNTEDTGNQSFPGDRGPEILPVITTRGGLHGILQT